MTSATTYVDEPVPAIPTEAAPYYIYTQDDWERMQAIYEKALKDTDAIWKQALDSQGGGAAVAIGIGAIVGFIMGVVLTAIGIGCTLVRMGVLSFEVG